MIKNIVNFFKKLLGNKSSDINNTNIKNNFSTVVDPKLILFEAFSGKSYSDTPKAIYKYMQDSEDFSNYHFVWAFTDTNKHGSFPDNTDLVEYRSKEYFEYCKKAGAVITNTLLDSSVDLKEDQQYILCHNTPFKKIGCDAGGTQSGYKIESEKITALLSNSRYCTEKLISAFDLKESGRENIIIEKGAPRNCALISYSEDNTAQIKRRLGLPNDKKIILYCPNQLDSLADLESIRKNCGDDFVLLFYTRFKEHSISMKKYTGYVFDMSDYDDINDLFIISDMMLTDYSDVIFDYAALDRPMIFYFNDVNTNDLYFGTAMLPGFTVQSQENLEEALSRVLNDMRSGGNGLLRYSAAMKAFRKKFSTYDCENCTCEIVKKIFNNS